MTLNVKHGLAAAWLAGLGGVFVAHAEVVQSDAAGEAKAQRHHAKHHDQFLSSAPVVTPQLAADAVAQGRFEGSSVPRWQIRQGPAGEPQARIYYIEHRGEFAQQVAEITPEQREAAQLEGWHERGPSRVFRDGGGWTLPAEFVPPKARYGIERGSNAPAWHGPAGEPQARIYYYNHRDEFGPEVMVITPEQRAAALAEGWHERAALRHVFRDGGQWTLPAEFIPPKESALTGKVASDPAKKQQRTAAILVIRDGGGWTVPAEFIPPKAQAGVERARNAPAWHGPAGEPQARVYYYNHRGEFEPVAMVITPEQRAAALAEGWHERATVRHVFRDGGQWTLPAEFIPPKETVLTGQVAAQPAQEQQRTTAILVYRDGGGWTVPAEFIPPKAQAGIERGRTAPAWHGPAGEPQARVYYYNHRDEFGPEVMVITPELRAAALAEGWHERAALRHVFRDGGGWTVPAEFIPPRAQAGMESARSAPAWHGPAGEPQARVYYYNHRGEFLVEAIEITPEQRAAARVEGWHERATLRHVFQDGGRWTLPAEFIPPKELVWVEPGVGARRPDGGR